MGGDGYLIRVEGLLGRGIYSGKGVWVVSPIPLFSSTLSSFTIYLDNIIMRSSDASPPFKQYEDGMVAECPILEVNTSRLLIEENIPRPTLQEGGVGARTKVSSSSD